MTHAERTTTKQELPEFEQLIILVNPASTRAHGVKRRIQELEDTFGTRVRIEHTLQDPQANDEQLRGMLRLGVIVGIGGGDGTVHGVVETLATGNLRGQKIPIFPLWGGNGNDFAHILNGRPGAQTPSQILQTGNVIPIYPIRGEFSSNTGTVTHIGAYSAGLGATGAVAERLNNNGYRSWPGYGNKLVRQAYEATTSIHTLTHTPSFCIEEAGVYKSLFERTIAHGERLAKYGHPPVQITEQRLFISDVSEKRFATMAGWIGRMALPAILEPPEGTYLNYGEQLAFTIHETPVYMHFDAEPSVLEPDTEAHVYQDDVPIYAISTRHTA